jgi:hypothetical protein
MRNLLALLGAALVAVAVVGWYLDWYKIQTEPGSAGHREVKIDINGPKIKQDLGKGREKLRDAIESKGQQPAAPNAAPTSGATNPQFPTPPGFGAGYPTPEEQGYVLPPQNTPSPTAPRVYRD